MMKETVISLGSLRSGGRFTIDSVAQNKERVILTNYGKPVAAIVSLEDLKILKSFLKREILSEESDSRIYDAESLGLAGMTVNVKYPDGKPMSGHASPCSMSDSFLFRTEIGTIRIRFSDVVVTKA